MENKTTMHPSHPTLQFEAKRERALTRKPQSAKLPPKGTMSENRKNNHEADDDDVLGTCEVRDIRMMVQKACIKNSTFRDHCDVSR